MIYSTFKISQGKIAPYSSHINFLNVSKSHDRNTHFSKSTRVAKMTRHRFFFFRLKGKILRFL